MNLYDISILRTSRLVLKLLSQHALEKTEVSTKCSVQWNLKLKKFKTVINSYLTGRYQQVTLGSRSDNSSKSKWEIIKCGVPQGSILGPLFFLFYINDLPKILTKNNNMVLYADDTSIIITDKNKLKFKISLNQICKQLNMWFNTNLLTLN
jgi:hypothetical protein